MPRSLAEQVLALLDEPRADTGPLSVADLARRFGVSSALMRSCAQQLISNGTAEATLATHAGVTTIQGLRSFGVRPEAASI